MVAVEEEEMALTLLQTHLVESVAVVMEAAQLPVLDLVVLVIPAHPSAVVAAVEVLVVTAVQVAMAVQVAVVLLFSEDQHLKE